MLTIVTHRNLDLEGYRNNWFEKSIKSISENLPYKAEHKIVHCDNVNTLNKLRWKALELSEYICFVDDDDYVLNNSLNLCLKALKANPDIGIAFTNEKHIDELGIEIKQNSQNNRSVKYSDVCRDPQSLHHLCVIRTRLVNKFIPIFYEKEIICSEWIIKASTALVHGAIHVPIEGYCWRRHSNSVSTNSKEWNIEYGKAKEKIIPYLTSLNKFGNNNIPKYIL